MIRTGGDEFVVLLPDLGLDSTREVAERLRRKGLASAPVSFTIGWAAREGSERVEDTIRRADHLLVRVRVEECKPRPRR